MTDYIVQDLVGDISSCDSLNELASKLKEYGMIEEDSFFIFCHSFFITDLEKIFKKIGIKPQGSFKSLHYHVAYFIKNQADINFVKLYLGLQKPVNGLRFCTAKELLHE